MKKTAPKLVKAPSAPASNTRLEQELAVQTFNLRQLVVSLRQENAQLIRKNAELLEAVAAMEDAALKRDLVANRSWMQENGFIPPDPPAKPEANAESTPSEGATP